MISVDILYILIGTCTVVVTVAFVWIVNEAIGLIKSLKISAKNTETVSEELKEKTMLVSEALDRVGTVATRVISFVEDMEAAVEQRASAIASSIGIIAGAKKFFVDGKKEEKPEPVKEEKKDSEEKKVQEDKIVESDKEEPSDEDEATEVKVKPDRQKAQEVEIETK